MSRAVVALFLGVFLMAAAPVSNNQQSEHPQTLQGPESGSPPALEQPCRRWEDVRQSELCAQWKAADAAKRAADIAFWTAVIAAIIGASTLAAAVKAAQYAKRAAEQTEAGAVAARESVGVTRDGIEASERLGIAQLRAYLSVAVESFTYDPDGWFDVTWKVTNSGQSPARNLHLLTQGLWKRNESGIFGQWLDGMGDLSAGSEKVSKFEFDALKHDGAEYFEFSVTAEYDTVFEGVKGKDEFPFEAFALDNYSRLVLRAKPHRRIMAVGERKREKKGVNTSQT